MWGCLCWQVAQVVYLGYVAVYGRLLAYDAINAVHE